MASGKILLAIALLAVSTHPALADGLTNGLPPTSMDSFVYEAGGQAEQIYGDESSVIGTGVYSLPPGVSPTPIAGFNAENRIEAGITGTRAAGLTTGHGSYLPDAWGRDEFLNGAAEFSMSGNQAGAQSPGPSFGVQASVPSSYGNASMTMSGTSISGIPNAVSNVVSHVTNAVNTTVNISSTLSNIAGDAGF